jgi:hypothetical protein
VCWRSGRRQPDAAFTGRHKETGFAVEEVGVRARSNGKGPRHMIWLTKFF